MCLLCAVLAWHESVRHRPTQGGLRAHALEPGPASSSHPGLLLPPPIPGPDGTSNSTSAFPGTTPRPPLVVYSSRTHSQLAQVVRELRKTPYAAKAVVLASRAHLCLHPDVKSLPSSAANTKCASLCQSQQCRWHKVYTQRQREPALAAQDYQPVADIEDLLTV